MQLLHQRCSARELLAIEGELQFAHRERDLVFFIQVFGVFGVAELTFFAQENLSATLCKKGAVCLSHFASNSRAHCVCSQ